MSTNKERTYTLVVTGMLVAVVLFLQITRLGIIQIPGLPLKITLFVIPIVIGLQTQNVSVGVVIGAFFGLASLYTNWASAPVLYSYLFRSPLVSVLPRIFIAPLAAIPLKMIRNRKAALYVSAVTGSLANTVCTLSAMSLMIVFLKTTGESMFFLNDIMPFMDTLGIGGHLALVWGGSLINAGLEAVTAAAICPLVAMAYDKIKHR